jgi:hypothetical protein
MNSLGEFSDWIYVARPLDLFEDEAFSFENFNGLTNTEVWVGEVRKIYLTGSTLFDTLMFSFLHFRPISSIVLAGFSFSRLLLFSS